MKPFSFALLCLLAFCLTTPSFGQSTPVNDKQAKRKEKSVPLTAERKQELLDFVEANHSELEELLSRLENSKKRRYNQAMAGLDKAVKKLETIKKRTPKRYDVALEQWKLESRIKVAGAQVKLNDTEETRAKLESLVTQLVDFHIQRLKNDRNQIEQRLQQTESRLKEFESNRDKMIEKRIKNATRGGKKAKQK